MNKILDLIAGILVVIGGLNWGLVGALKFNLVEWAFGAGLATMIIYIVVGVAALWMIVSFFMKKE